MTPEQIGYFGIGCFGLGVLCCWAQIALMDRQARRRKERATKNRRSV